MVIAMPELDVFLSVGRTATLEQENFVRAVEERLRGEGIVAHTVGRNTFAADAPLKTVTALMDRSSGAIVVALERKYFQTGVEKRGGPEQEILSEVRLPTVFNHIEAAMAYSRGLPLMVVVEKGLKMEGLLERGYDWYVQVVEPNASALTTLEFNSVLTDWKGKMQQRNLPDQTGKKVPVSVATIGELISSLRPAELWSVLAALAAVVAGAFVLGGKLFGGP
jgi:hypothetical protein